MTGRNRQRPVTSPFKSASVFLLALFLLVALPVQQTSFSQSYKTDLNIVVAIDCSYSVSRAEFELQVNGIAKALLSDEVIEAIQSGNQGRIGLSIIQWSGPNSQVVVTPWTVVSSVEEAAVIADTLVRTPRLTSEGVTAMGSALMFAVNHLLNAPIFGERQVIDMQADGTNTWARGVPMHDARDYALKNDVVVNGLPILNEVKFLHHYFRNHVIGGPGSFIEIAKDYEAFEKAIKRKLVREIRGMTVS